MAEFKPIATACHNFKEHPEGSMLKLTVIIVPLRIEEEGNNVKISWACSLGKNCCFYQCEYAYGKA
jgi:hypothetical protein